MRTVLTCALATRFLLVILSLPRPGRFVPRPSATASPMTTRAASITAFASRRLIPERLTTASMNSFLRSIWSPEALLSLTTLASTLVGLAVVDVVFDLGEVDFGARVRGAGLGVGFLGMTVSILLAGLSFHHNRDPMASGLTGLAIW